ncbi:S-adenosyl-L-homocysteine hydrolase [Parerythrobacter aurantius]|uniref:S-adenosyl-L-homocysteine hydrolase n=1 Tax=Parerythrobacter aurantius TaxID=3127706 RepID=UPI00324F6B45
MKITGLRAHAASLGVVLAVLASVPAQAMYSHGEAEALRKLDIMLMVSSLRCRFGEDNFQADYERFSARHLSTLNGAYRTLHDGLSRTHGPKRATRMLDDISVKMANRYGLGHPWLDCRQLKEVTRELADRRSGDELLADAGYLLADGPGTGRMIAAR